MLLEHLLQILGVVVPDQPCVPSRADVFQERTKTSSRLRIGGHRDDTNGPSVKVTLDRKNLGLAVGNLLLLVTPFTSELDSSLYGLCTSVHRENHVVAKHGGDLLSKGAKVGGVESSGRESELGGLSDKGVHCKVVDELRMIDRDSVCRPTNFRMAMALVNRSVNNYQYSLLPQNSIKEHPLTNRQKGSRGTHCPLGPKRGHRRPSRNSYGWSISGALLIVLLRITYIGRGW